jgi:hypothetical protein
MNSSTAITIDLLPKNLLGKLARKEKMTKLYQKKKKKR